MSETTVTRTSGTTASKRAGTRGRIVRAAAGLLAEGGREAVSTRAVAAAAGVQAPTIYRLFGDMRGLLDEVASFGFSAYLRDKTAREREEDPVEDLRRRWDLHIEFGLANPALYKLIYGDPVPGTEPTAALAAEEMLHGLVQRLAEAGRLRVGVERAAGMIHAAATGVVLTLIGADPADRDQRKNAVEVGQRTTPLRSRPSCQRRRKVLRVASGSCSRSGSTGSAIGFAEPWSASLVDAAS